MFKIYLAAAALTALVGAIFARLFSVEAAVLLIGLPCLLTVVYDLFQRKHSLGRAFPALWRGRLLAEEMRPEFQQYFIETNTSGKPASRNDRSWSYASSKGDPTDISFGTEKDYHQPGQIHIRHKGMPLPDRVKINLKPIVLGPNRRKPAYLHGRFGVSDMSFGSIFERAKQAITSGAAEAGAAVCLGEGGPTPYDFSGVYVRHGLRDLWSWRIRHYGLGWANKQWRHEPRAVSRYLGGAQLIPEIGTGKFGFKNPDGSFDWERYKAFMADDSCIASKFKLHQGAKPGGGGHLPGYKVNELISKIRRIPQGEDCISPNCFDEWDSVAGMMAFITRAQEETGKPVGIKIAIGDDSFIEEIARWMSENPGMGPDFIHLDGGEGGTGSAPLMLADYVGMSILHAIPLVDNVLRKHGVRDRVVLMSSGKVFNPAQLFIQLALGSDYVFGARGVMFSLGCIQAKKCGTNQCPSGVATNHWWLKRALVPMEKYIRTGNYIKAMNRYLITLLRVAGKTDTYLLTRNDIMQVTSSGEVPMDKLVPYPAGCDGLRLAPIAESHGLTAPDAPPGPRPMSAEIRALFGEFFDEHGRLINGGEGMFDTKEQAPAEQLVHLSVRKK